MKQEANLVQRAQYPHRDFLWDPGSNKDSSVLNVNTFAFWPQNIVHFSVLELI